VLEPGEAVVDARKLSDIAGKFKGDVRIEEAADHLIIKNGRSRITLTKRFIEYFPPPLVIDAEPPSIDLTAADVRAIFEAAAAGAAIDDTRMYLAGPVIFGEATDFGHRLCAVGADSVALSFAGTTVAAPDLGRGRLIHRNICRLAVSLFGKTGASLRLGARLIELESDNARIVAKLIDETPSAGSSRPSCPAPCRLVE
jgi:DNA polymerase III sliding clamp (beta) subunit (PCNA family)